MSEFDVDRGEGTYLFIQSTTGEFANSSWIKPLQSITPGHWIYRYIILLLISGIQFILSFTFDLPAGLESVLINMLHIDVSRYTLLYSIYSWPSIVLTVVGTVLINRHIGIRCGTVLFMVVLAVGQCLFAAGAFTGDFWLMMVAHFILGVGGEVLFSTTDAFAAQWFRDKDITIAFGIISALSRLGGAAGLYINNIVYNFCGFVVNRQLRLGVALMLSVSLVIIGVALAVALAIINKTANLDEKHKNKSKLAFKELLKFNVNLWIVVTVCILLFSAIFPFLGIAQVFLVCKFGLSVNQANTANLMIFLIPVGTPLMGFLINWTGFNIYWSIGGMLAMFSTHLVYLLSSRSLFIPYITNGALGLSFGCIYTALWAAPSFLVNDNQLVTVYGILEAGVNLGLAVTNMASGQVIDTYGYFMHQLMLPLLYTLVATLLLFILMCNLLGTENQVNMSGWQRRRNLAVDANMN